MKAKKKKTKKSNRRREHAGGVPEVVKSYGAHHPLVDFDFDAIEQRDPETRSIQEFSDALVEITEWLTCTKGRKNKCPRLTARRQHGIAVRVMALNYILRPHAMGVVTQKDLAQRVGVSRAWLCEVVAQFVERFGFEAQHMHIQRQVPKRGRKTGE